MTTLKALVKTSYNFDIDLDRVRGEYNKVSGKLNAYVRDALSSNSSPVIPPVEDEFAPPPVPQKGEKKKGRGPLTDQEIEDAIGDLFDYFNETFGTLKENLSQEGARCLSPGSLETSADGCPPQLGISSSRDFGRTSSRRSKLSSCRRFRTSQPR